MYRPRNVDEYIDLVQQAIFEIDELLACAEDEGDGESEFVRILPALQQIASGLKAMQADIKAGTHVIARDESLPFLAVIAENRQLLPAAITGMLDALNLAHKKGFAESPQG
jgi:hypothetical protein